MSESFFEHAPCLFFATNDNGILLQVNEATSNLLQFSKHELSSQKAELFYTVATKIFHQTHLFPLLKMQGFADEIYITLKKKNGDELPVLLSVERKTINDNIVVLYAGNVVHHRKKFEEELITAKKTAEAALNENTALLQARNALQEHSEELDKRMFIVNKQNDELKQFNRVVTHDLQEPLRKLSVFSNMLATGIEVQQRENMLTKINRIAADMRSKLSGLQQYIWLNDSAVNVTDIELQKLLLHVKRQLEQKFPEVQFIIKTEGNAVFEGSREQMLVLFSELLSNAIRFSKEQDKAVISIVTEIIQLNQFKKVEGKYKYVDHVRIQIKDEGVGFDPQFKSQLFELFKKLHSQSGQGIGLALCKKIIENHHGSISIDSIEGEGTVVTLLLPAEAPKDLRMINT